jgi:hypothetical protein
MVTISLPINMDIDQSIEAKRQLIHDIETINQRRGILEEAQKGHLEYLTKIFNEGSISIPDLEKALKVIIQQALNMAKKN